MVEGQKMAKSLGNFYTLRDLLARGYPPEAVRYLLASVPYRKKLNFTFDGLKAAATAIERLRNFELRLDTGGFAGGLNEAIAARTEEARRQFEEALDDDLNTAEALAAVFEYIRESNIAMDSGAFRRGNVAGARDLIERFDRVFDVIRPTVTQAAISDEEVEALIRERAEARKARDFARADQIRALLLEKGIILEDTREGVRWKRK
jgi:cysteinyl-tRNA synthetase